jgi:CheY-like chemotaxis protein
MSKESPTIMVVEDETLLLQAITKKLKVSGMDVLSCASGQQAVDYLTSMDVLPDAVWLDYYLKDMNGLAFMQELKAKPEWSGIPVIVVSNSASPDKVSNMLALGAKKYILKAEYRLDEIIGMIKEFISDNSSGATAIAAAAAAEASAPGAPGAAPLATSVPEVAATEPAAAAVASVPESDEPAAPAAAAPVVVDAPAVAPVPAETPATSLQAATPEVQPSAPSPAAAQAPAPAAATNDVTATDEPVDGPSSQAKPAA